MRRPLWTIACVLGAVIVGASSVACHPNVVLVVGGDHYWQPKPEQADPNDPTTQQDALDAILKR